ncbi:MAG: hypothetical protein ACR2GU_05745 [Rubrobacteraceae bacterium]
MVLGLVSTLALITAGCSGSGKSSSSAGQKEAPQTTAGKSQTQGTTVSKSATTAAKSEASSVGRLGHPVLGEKNAPVTMIEYGDYQ